jgi:hypothetical protein
MTEPAARIETSHARAMRATATRRVAPTRRWHADCLPTCGWNGDRRSADHPSLERT